MGITIKKNDPSAPATKLGAALKPLVKPAPTAIGAEADVGLETKTTTMLKAPTKALIKPGTVAKPAPAPANEPEPETLPDDADETSGVAGDEEGNPISDHSDTGADDVQSENIVGTTTTIHGDGSTSTKEEDYGSVKSAGPMARVAVEMGLTKNLGNYESLRVAVRIEIPCKVDGDEIENTYEQAKAWCDDKINEINAEVSAQTE